LARSPRIAEPEHLVDAGELGVARAHTTARAGRLGVILGSAGFSFEHAARQHVATIPL
jgi:hypothetical protein